MPGFAVAVEALVPEHVGSREIDYDISETAISA